MGDMADDAYDRVINEWIEAEGDCDEGWWTTGQGNTIHISKMEISHIENCINMLKKKNRKRRLFWIKY